MLTDADLKNLTRSLIMKGESDLTNFIRGKLYSDIIHFRKSSKKYAEKAIKYFTEIKKPKEIDENEILRSLAICYKICNYPAFKKLIPQLLESCDPEWRGYDLIAALDVAIAHNDWGSYDEWRKEWNKLPRNAHNCECNFNQLYTFDGLRDLNNNKLSAIPKLLRKATRNKGCAHLNTGSAKLELVKKLIKQKIFPKETLTYINACSKFYPNDKRLNPLRKKIESIKKTNLREINNLKY